MYWSATQAGIQTELCKRLNAIFTPFPSRSGSARTTEAVRRAIQHSQESLRVLAKRPGINQKTVAKWNKRTAVKDLPTGPTNAHSTVLRIVEEAIIVAFRS